MVAENDGRKRMGENIGALGDVGRRLAYTGAEGQMNMLADSDITYKAGCGVGRLSAETTSANGWSDGRYTIGVNIGAGAEIAGTVHKASEESVE